MTAAHLSCCLTYCLWLALCPTVLRSNMALHPRPCATCGISARGSRILCHTGLSRIEGASCAKSIQISSIPAPTRSVTVPNAIFQYFLPTPSSFVGTMYRTAQMAMPCAQGSADGDACMPPCAQGSTNVAKRATSRKCRLSNRSH